MPDEILDAAVVGGGVSGVYAAWRLLTTGQMERVTVFEASDRIGGRLLSVTPPKIPCMTAELGGMRYIPAVQPRLRRLIEVVNSLVQPGKQIQTYKFPVDNDDNIAYLRGVHLRLKDFKNKPEKVPYHLTFQEDNKIPADLVTNAIEQVVPGITKKGLTEDDRRKLAREAKFNDVWLYEQGFWQVLMRVMSCEAYQLAIAALGYESTLTNWNAADAIPWYLSDFGLDVEYRGFTDGFQQVPLTLAGLVEEAGGKVVCGATVIGFKEEGDVIELSVKGGEAVRARRLILAMPRRALELIAEHSPLLQDKGVKEMIQSVTPRPLFKLFTTYEYPWWASAGVKQGRSTTDLPVRQTYYWPQNNGEPVTEGNAMLMASYDDGLNVGFWDSFRPQRQHGLEKKSPQEKKNPALPPFTGGGNKAGDDAPDQEWKKYTATEAMVEEVQRQLATMHGLQFTPKVCEASFKDWGDDPFGGGWNSWNIGVESWKVKDAIINPKKGVPVYICGEAYSNAQGWVEGALETADLMLKKYFRIKPLEDPD